MNIVVIGKTSHDLIDHRIILLLVEPLSIVYVKKKDLKEYIVTLTHDELTETIYEAQRRFRHEAKYAPVIDADGLEFIEMISGHKYFKDLQTSHLELARAFCKIARNEFESEREKRELTLFKQFLFFHLS